MNWLHPFGKSPEEKQRMESIEKSLPFGGHRPLELVAQETGLSRQEVLNLDGVTYHSHTDQVRRDEPGAKPPAGFRSWAVKPGK
jgi:hypothetical protein